MNGSPNFFLPKPDVICNYDPLKNKTTSKEHSFLLKSWDYNSGGSSFLCVFFVFFYNNDDHILQTNNKTLKQKKVYV